VGPRKRTGSSAGNNLVHVVAFARAGAVGLTNEVLLAIVKDRLEAFQAGPYACRENAVALNGIDKALAALHSRTKARIFQGVEGKDGKHVDGRQGQGPGAGPCT
jgi:hypothetical protein